MSKGIGCIDFDWEVCLGCASADQDGSCTVSDNTWESRLEIDLYDEIICCGCYVEKED